jgi:hypothetical protein
VPSQDMGRVYSIVVRQDLEIRGRYITDFEKLGECSCGQCNLFAREASEEALVPISKDGT